MEQEKQWKEIDPSMWKPEVGDSIEGVYVNKKEDQGDNHSNIYQLDSGEGIVGVWGSTILDDRMELVNIGDYIKITYKELTKNQKKQDLKIYKVEVAQSST